MCRSVCASERICAWFICMMCKWERAGLKRRVLHILMQAWWQYWCVLMHKYMSTYASAHTSTSVRLCVRENIRISMNESNTQTHIHTRALSHRSIRIYIHGTFTDIQGTCKIRKAYVRAFMHACSHAYMTADHYTWIHTQNNCAHDNYKTKNKKNTHVAKKTHLLDKPPMSTSGGAPDSASSLFASRKVASKIALSSCTARNKFRAWKGCCGRWKGSPTMLGFGFFFIWPW